jgi:serine/threonine protein kinase
MCCLFAPILYLQDITTAPSILKQIRHPNIIQLLGVCTREPPLLIITEFMPNGSILDYLQGPGKDVGMAALLNMAQQVCSAMVYLHSVKIIHRYVLKRLSESSTVLKEVTRVLKRLLVLYCALEC